MTKVLLIGNYPPLRQESMARFARSLHAGLASEPELEATLWIQPSIAYRLSGLLGRWSGKWLGYVDLYLLAPAALALRRLMRPADRYHICDHSDSPLALVLPKGRTSITCHDVIAIESAFGASEHGVRPTALGKWQQRYIRHFLVRFNKVVSVSDYTRQQLREVAASAGVQANDKWPVIYNKFTADFRPYPWLDSLYKEHGLSPGKYLFHLGSGHPRKNRALLIEVLNELPESFADFKLCLAGGPPEAHELAVLAVLGVSELGDRVTWIGRVDHNTAAALYTHCFAFVFPSLSEGFGLPIAEAQACGAPVVASQRLPMPEVAGDGALYADPLSARSFAATVEKLTDEALRADLVEKGLRNVLRYRPQTVDHEYASLLRCAECRGH